jgi:glycosyltransferase involved in cell wall biosynthesis
MATERTCGRQHDGTTDIATDDSTYREGATRNGVRMAPHHGARFVRPLVRERAGSSLRIAMLAPPWIPVPAPGYGGIEAVVEVLCDRLVADHHDVTLFAAPGSSSRAHVQTLLAQPFPEAIGRSLQEVDHVARAFDEIDRAARAGQPFDVVHDHTGFGALAMADRLRTPMVHTVHGEFTDEIRAFYAEHAHKALVVALSASQRASGPSELATAPVVPNPIDLRRWPLVPIKDDYLLWIGRIEEIKGPHRAIEVATRAARRVVLAGPVQPGQERFFADEIEPRLDGDRVRYVGEVTGRAKIELFANAAALLMPIRWQEPFGLVMTEALACGTPVLAFAEGAAREIVLDGHNGFLVQDEDEMTAAIANIGLLDPATCRDSVAIRYDAELVTRAYEQLYRQARFCRDPRRLPPSPLVARDDPPRGAPRGARGVSARR